MIQHTHETARRRHVFILGLWQEGGATPGKTPVWRYSLENPRTAERRGFGDARDLLAMLEQWMALPAHHEPTLHNSREDITP